MVPTLHPNDIVFARRASFTPKLNDIVIFRSAQDASQLYIKRIVAMPGEVVSYNGKSYQVNLCE
jgi:signal peptidase I